MCLLAMAIDLCSFSTNCAQAQQLKKVFMLLRLGADPIEHFLLTTFPTYMKYQQHKISASSQELGSDMLFDRQIGFSGTQKNDFISFDIFNTKFL